MIHSHRPRRFIDQTTRACSWMVRAADVILLLLVVTSVAPAAAAEPGSTSDSPPLGEMKLPRLDGAKLTLDGKLNESLWSQADAPQAMVLTGADGGEPEAGAEVRAFYDTQYLYVGITCHQQDMEGLVPGLPPGQTVDTPIASSADAVELFISADDDLHRYHHLRIAPSGAKSDARGYRASLKPHRAMLDLNYAWHGDWQVATHLEDDRWTVEARLRLSTFARDEAYLGTPTAGESWRVQVARVCSTTGEFSVWSPNPPSMFHSPQRFGRFVFAEPADTAKQIAVSDVKVAPGVVGDNVLTATLENSTSTPRTLRAIVDVKGQHEGQPAAQTEVTVPVEGTAPLRLAVPVRSGGDVRMRLRLMQDEQLVHEGAWRRQVYPIVKRLEEVTDTVAAVQSELEELAGGDAAQRREIDEQAQRLAAEAAQLHKATDMAWAARVEQAEQLSAEAEALRRSFWHRLRARALTQTEGVEEPGVAVGVALSGEKVFRDDVFTGAIGGPAVMRAARNEYESVQLVVIPLRDDVGHVTARVSSLVHEDEPNEVIHHRHVNVAKVGYIDVGTKNPGHRHGLWPDVLYPDAETDLEPGALQPMMLTVRTRPAFEPGVYRGTVELTPDHGEAVTVPLELHIWPFRLPSRKTLRTDIWFWKARPASYYKTAWSDGFTLDMFRYWADLLGQYHMPPAPRNDILAEEFRLIRNTDGTIDLDFSAMVPYWQEAMKRGANVLHIDPLPPSYFMKPDKPWQAHARIVDAETGEVSDFVADDPEAMATRYLRELTDLFERRGWLEHAVHLAGDEPWNAARQAEFRENAARMRAVAPEVPITGAGTVPKRMGLEEAIDIWCPQFLQYDPADYVDSEKGLWFYQCLYKPGYPTFLIDRPGIEPRIAFWVCWKADATGFLYWTSTQWDAGNMRGRKLKSDHGRGRWVDENWELPWPTIPGDGSFFYPQPHRVVPSLRAQAMRDGIEDYEYLAILRRRYEAARSQGQVSQDLARRVEAALDLPRDVVHSMTDWTTSLERLAKMRRQIANLIIELEENSS